MTHPPQPTKDKTAREWADELAFTDMGADLIEQALLAYSKQAVEAEREACAKVAEEGCSGSHGYDDTCGCGLDIAKAIRSRGKS